MPCHAKDRQTDYPIYSLQTLAHELPSREAEPPLQQCQLEHIPHIRYQPWETEQRTLDGPTPPGYNLACSLVAISCRTWERYLAGNQYQHSQN